MHCEIIATSTYFFVEIQLKKENLKSVFLAPEFGCPNWYIDFPNSLNMSLATLELLGTLETPLILLDPLKKSLKPFTSLVTLKMLNPNPSNC